MFRIKNRLYPVPFCRGQSLLLTAWLVVLSFTVSLLAHAAPAEPAVAEAARKALASGQQTGKVRAHTYNQLLQQFGRGQRVRVLVQLDSTDEPMARLPGRKAKSQAVRNSRRQAIARSQAKLLGRPGLRALRDIKRFRHVPFLALEVNARELTQLANQPDVVSISSDELLQPTLHNTVPQIGADQAWLQGYAGSGQVVAIVDTGVDTAHQSFAGRIVDEACFSSTSTAENSTSLCPNGTNPNGQDSQIGPGAGAACSGLFGCDHGTHVAGIAAGADGTYRGIAPEAGILPIQVFSQYNGFFACNFAPPCLSALTSDLVRALEHVYDLSDTHSIAAVNMSLGGESYSNAADCDAAYPAIQAAVENLRSVGIVPVAASGNSSDANGIATPACVSGMVSVGAVDGLDAVASFSNSSSELDTLAPGVSIVSAVPGNGFGAKSGTSMATPALAGTVAVLRSADSNATTEEIVDAVKTTGVPVLDSRNGVVAPRVQVDAAADLLTQGDLARITLALQLELSGLNAPVGVTHAGDGSGRLFILQRAGTVLVRDVTGLLSVPFLDVSASVNCCAAEGLLGLAFHPNYAANGFVYVSYLNALGEVVIERYTRAVDPNQVDAGSALEILRVPTALNGHHGGRLQFGPDGYLYVATGDGAQNGGVNLPGTAPDPGNLLGKVLRIDIDAPGVPYSIPPDNPLLGAPGARDEIWSLGLRDPRHFSFDALAGDLFIADVGESAAHEVNVQPPASSGGENYGWPTMEGTDCRDGQSCDTTGLTLPVAEYPFAEGCAVTGGVVYRGPSYPDLYGAYLFGDACSGRVWGLRQQDGQWHHEPLTQTTLQISAFGSDEAGAAYVVDQPAGQIYRLLDSDLSIASVLLADAYLNEPYAETLSASGGNPPYQWSLVDGALPAGITLNPTNGTLTGSATSLQTAIFTVRVQDSEFASVSRTLRLTSTPQPLTINPVSLPDATTNNAYLVNLGASGGTPPYAWQVSSGALPAGITLNASGVLSGTATAQGVFNFSARVSDGAGAQATTGLALSVYGATTALAVNAIDAGAYGNNFGSNAHLLGLYTTFTGTDTDLTLQVTGYDIDFADELMVTLNGVPIGYLATGPNVGLNAGDSFTISAAAQQEGVNVIGFHVKTSGWTWGVTDLLLTSGSEPLAIGTTTLADAMYGEAYVATLQATGGVAPYQWTLTQGSLPAGITLNADGTISGIADAQGEFDFTARVTDVAGTAVEQSLTLNSYGPTGTFEVVLQLNVTDTGAFGHNYGSNVHYDELYVTFTGTGADLTFTVDGYDVDSADEVALTLNGSPLGFLSTGPNNAMNAGDYFIIPAAAQIPGLNQIKLKQKVPGWKWGVTNLRITDAPLPSIITTELPATTTDSAYDFNLLASGGTQPYDWEVVSGALPPGIVLDADGSLSGTASAQGVFNFVARVTAAEGLPVTQGLSLAVYGSAVPLSLNAEDNGAYGNSYGSNQHAAGLIATFMHTGTDLTLHVTGYDIDFADELEVTLNGVPIGYLSVGANVSLNGGDVFSVPAAAQQPGLNQILFKVKTVGWIWGVTDLLLTDVPSPPAIATTGLPDSRTDTDYDTTLTALGGMPPLAWTVSSGALPPGITLNTSGALSGFATAQGKYSFNVRVTDDNGEVSTKALTISVYGATLPLEPNVTETGAYGNRYGSNAHKLGLYATFAGTNADLTLQVTGYDIDFTDELLVTLNGEPIGYLSKGPNVGLNGGDQFTIPAADQLPGTNLIRFKVKTAGWTWGVTDLSLSDGG